MKRRAARTLCCTLALWASVLVAAPSVLAQGAPPPAETGDDAKREAKGKKAKARKAMSPEMRALVKKYRSLAPSERKRLVKRFKDELASRTPEERKRLRKLAKRLKQNKKQKAQRKKHRERLKAMDPERRKRYTKLVRTVIHRLPPEERSAFAQLEPKQRQAKLRSLLQTHRKGLVSQRMAKLPEDVRRQTHQALEGLEGKERFRKARKLVETYVRGRAQEIMRNPNLTPTERRQRLRALMGRHVPDRKRREALLKRFQQRRAKGGPRGRRGGQQGDSAAPERGADMSPRERERRRELQKRRAKGRGR